MIVYPPAKINIGLHVLRKRQDQFHDIETLFFPSGLTDILEIIPSSDNTSITVTGLIPEGDVQDNLCMKAYHLFRAHFNVPEVKMHLHKLIPSGAGLGGGSSDAAYTLLCLNKIFNTNCSPSDLKKMAAELGSDCSFFIDPVPSIGTGRGEILEHYKVKLSGLYIVLLIPKIHVSTRQAYSGIHPDSDRPSIKHILSNPISEWKNTVVNDFEKTVFQLHPLLGLMKEKLYQAGALYASMSGSGSAMYGIFSAKSTLKENFPEHFHYEWKVPENQN